MPQLPSNYSPELPFVVLDSVDSTNNYARRLLDQADLPIRHTSALHGTAIFAHEQTAGKGQRGKGWISDKYANIAVSMIINPSPLSLAKQFHLNAAVAVAIHDFFRKYAGDNTKIKWPNDLYWQDKKAGGVLIENVITKKNWKWPVIGVGININQTVFSPELPNPISLKQITGNRFDTVMLARELCVHIWYYFQQLLTGGFENIFSAYNSGLYKKNETVKLKKENRVFETRIKGVSSSGQLVTQHAIEESFDFGNVEWVIQ